MSRPGSVAPDNLIGVQAAVSIGAAARPLAADVARQIARVVVDTSLHLPDMVEIVFDDPAVDVLRRGGITIGTILVIAGAAAGTTSSDELFRGEVTAIEGIFDGVSSTVVRGYTADHRLQRRRTTRTFVNMTDSDIAAKVAREAGLTVGEVIPTRTAHDHVAQVNQSDWEFLRSRAVRIGHEFGVTAGAFWFRPASGVGSGRAVTLDYPAGLHTFHPRVTAGNLAGSAEARTWDPVAARAATSVVPTATGSAELTGMTAASVATAFAPPRTLPTRAAAAAPGRDLGPAPAADAHVIGGWAMGGATARSAGDEAAAGIADHLGSTFAEAEAEAAGDPRLLAGATVAIGGVGDAFGGTWTITRALHVFDEFGYQTRFEVSGRQERSLLGLATGGPDPTPRIPGMACGIVTNVGDPQKLGRVKLALPWLSPTFETDWAPVVAAGAGARSAALFGPDVGDEVLVGFELGDPHRPYVLGGLLNSASKFTLGGEPVKRAGQSASVVWRGVVSPSGNRLAFHDELPPSGAGAPMASDMVLGTAGADMALVIDQTAGTVALRCSPKAPGSRTTKGTLTIECGPMGAINIVTGAGGAVTVDGGAQLTLKASTAISIESNGPVSIKGNPIKLN